MKSWLSKATHKIWFRGKDVLWSYRRQALIVLNVPCFGWVGQPWQLKVCAMIDTEPINWSFLILKWIIDLKLSFYFQSIKKSTACGFFFVYGSCNGFLFCGDLLLAVVTFRQFTLVLKLAETAVIFCIGFNTTNLSSYWQYSPLGQHYWLANGTSMDTKR